jgi:hypothetical protein
MLMIGIYDSLGKYKSIKGNTTMKRFIAMEPNEITGNSVYPYFIRLLLSLTPSQ